MKKTLSLVAVVAMAAVIGTQAANAFTWSNLNPFTWGQSSRCEQKSDCGCHKIKKCDPCERISEPCSTGAAAPCDCVKKSPCSMPAKQPCSPCDRLQEMSR